MKKIYSAPELKIKRFNVEDIITTSVNMSDMSSMSNAEIEQAKTAVSNYFSTTGKNGTYTKMKDATSTDWSKW